MKKKLLYLFIGVFGFFFFSCLRVNAATNVPLDFDKHEHFNYYYEFMHNTKFYQFVIGKGDSFGSFLKSYNNQLGQVFFAYASDINVDTTGYHYAPTSIPEDSKYVIILPSNTISFYLSYSTGKYYISDYGGSGSQYQFVTYLFYDDNMNLLDTDTCGYTHSLNVDYGYEDFTYIMGSYYGKFDNYSNSFSSTDSFSWYNQSNNSFDIRVTFVRMNNDDYVISDLQTRSVFGIFWYNLKNAIFNDGLHVDLDDVGLGFLRKNYVMGKRGDDDNRLAGIFMCFSDSDSPNINISVPDGYQSQSFNYDNRYYLVPNSLSCSNADSLLYFNTSDVTSINFISYDLLQDHINYNNLKTYSFKLKYVNVIEALDLHSVIGSSSVITDNFYIISSSDNFGTNTVYYNSNCFTSYVAISNNDIQFENINTGNTVSITPAEQQMIFYNSNSTIDKIVEEQTEFSMTDVISTAWSGSKTFISASYYILSMVTNLFIALPGEVKGVLICVFTIGMVVILWKVFRS